jgi:hypothetical protein
MRVIRLLMVLAMVVGGWWLWNWHTTRSHAEERDIRHTQQSLQKLAQEIRLRAALGDVELNATGWPQTIDPAWFKGNTPHNMLIIPGAPWVEIARPEEEKLDHPTVRMSLDRATAGFWYNPSKGIVRARIGPTVSDERALALYNRINSARLASIFSTGDPDLPPADDAITTAGEPRAASTR